MWFVALVAYLLLHPSQPSTFTNPVSPRGADPWVVREQDRYYYCFSRNGAVNIRSSDSLVNLFRAEPVKVWEPEPGQPWSKGLWAPELHRIDGTWSIYVAAADRWPGGDHRMHLLQREDPDPLGPFEHVGQVQLPEDKWAIDGTPLELGGQLYFVWSGWPGDEDRIQNLYIAAMEDPASAVGERVMISTPEHDWEQVGVPLVNEGPQVLKHGERTFIIYSASGSWTDDYCLGLLEFVGEDPLDPQSWEKHPEPVFAGTGEVISPGHPSFTTSPDGSEHWIAYHTARYPGAGWSRNVQIQPFTFDEEGFPIFGEPVAPGVTLPVPSGESVCPVPEALPVERRRTEREKTSPPSRGEGDDAALSDRWDPWPYLSISSAPSSSGSDVCAEAAVSGSSVGTASLCEATVGRISTSTRRFWARPFSLLLLATGR